MKKEGYYSSGQFAGMAHVTLRTIRYYDKQDILKPLCLWTYYNADAVFFIVIYCSLLSFLVLY